MLLRHTCKLEREARLVEEAVSATLDEGYGTADLASARQRVSTTELGEVVRRKLSDRAWHETVMRP